ncbi:TatD family hydrolase [Lachnospiraceae bacterium JLR.KK008]
MIFETHAHYDDAAFEQDRDELLCSLPENDIKNVINVSSSLQSVSKTIALSEKYPFVYAAAGIHPSETGELTEESFQWLRAQCDHEKVISVGEIGLDYYWKEPSPEIQKKWFERQLHLAQEINLPVIIHSREAAKDTLDMMKQLHAERSGGVIHCFSYTKETAREFLNMDYYFGIGGVVTFHNAKKLKEAVAYIPIEKIVLETDSPYLAPVPNRGKRNSSLNLPFIAKEIANIKGISYDKVVEITRENGEKLWHI